MDLYSKQALAEKAKKRMDPSSASYPKDDNTKKKKERKEKEKRKEEELGGRWPRKRASKGCTKKSSPTTP